MSSRPRSWNFIAGIPPAATRSDFMIRILLVQIGCKRDEFNEPLAIACLEAGIRRDEPHGEIYVTQVWDKLENPDIGSLLTQDWDIVGFSLEIGSLDRFIEWYEALTAVSPTTIAIAGNVIPTHSYAA